MQCRRIRPSTRTTSGKWQGAHWQEDEDHQARHASVQEAFEDVDVAKDLSTKERSKREAKSCTGRAWKQKHMQNANKCKRKMRMKYFFILHFFIICKERENAKKGK